MIVDIQPRRLRTIEQLRAFVEGNEAVDIQPRDRGEAYGFVRAMLERFGYRKLGKRDKGVVLRFLVAATGISRKQMERLVRQWRDSGTIRDRRGGNRGRPFARKYAAADIRLLAEVDEAFGQMSGLATREVLRRQFEVFGDARFARLAAISNGHVYNLRNSATYRAKRTAWTRTRPATVAIGPRQAPEPEGRPGPCARRHGAPGRPRRGQGPVPDQPGRRGHPARVRRRRDRHLGALPPAAARGPAAVLPVRHPRLPRRQRQRAHQPPGGRPPPEAARWRVHEVARAALQRQRAGRGQERARGARASRPRAYPGPLRGRRGRLTRAGICRRL